MSQHDLHITRALACGLVTVDPDDVSMAGIKQRHDLLKAVNEEVAHLGFSVSLHAFRKGVMELKITYDLHAQYPLHAMSIEGACRYLLQEANKQWRRKSENTSHRTKSEFS